MLSKHSYSVRKLIVDDFAKVFTLWQEAGLQLYPEDAEHKRYEDMLSLNGDLCFALLDENSQIMGTILGGFDGRTASVHRLAITPELQAQGLGKFLITTLEDALRQRGIKKLSAQVHIANTKVIPFYEKLGFAEMTYVKTFFKDL